MLDPLIRFKEALHKGVIPADTYNLVLKRFPIAVEGINRIEKASKIRYPVAYVEPAAVAITLPHRYLCLWPYQN